MRAEFDAGADGRRHRQARGVTLVETALILPVLILLLFGIIEFGWAYSQQLDVRHGAREGARLAAVNFSDDTAVLRSEVCRRLEADDDVYVAFIRSSGAIGSDATVVVQRDLEQLTGLLDFALDDITLRSSVVTRLELEAGWTADFTPTAPDDISGSGTACPAP